MYQQNLQSVASAVPGIIGGRGSCMAPFERALVISYRLSIVTRVPTGQGKLEKSGNSMWSGKVRERSGKNIFLEKSGKSQGK